jgi:Kdo2-lipid IVA lauroyltransferase/acyltransferase
MKRFFDYLVYLLALVVLQVLKHMPRDTAYRFTRRGAKLFYWLSPWHRTIIHRNLVLAMPHLTREEAKNIAIHTFWNICLVAIELIRLPRLKNMSPEELSEVVQMPKEVLGQIRELIARGKGLLYLTGHFGVWELLANTNPLIIKGPPLSIVVRPLDNPYLDRLVTKYRTYLGNRLLAKKNSVRDILAALRRRESVAVLLDQNVCREEGVFVDLFGMPACTSSGLAMLAMRTGAPVLPVGLFYNETSKVHTVHLEPEVPIVKTGDRETDLRVNTAAFTKALESMTRKHPEQWLWAHRRWKTRPTDDRSKVYA